jgi:hypothetical protein
MESTSIRKVMIIQIDVTQKKITVLQNCTIDELNKFLKEHRLKDYRIEVSQIYCYYPSYVDGVNDSPIPTFTTISTTNIN